jgi:hypothetical protein
MKQIPCGNGNKKSKDRSGFPAGMTERKAKTEADSYGMTN